MVLLTKLNYYLKGYSTEMVYFCIHILKYIWFSLRWKTSSTIFAHVNPTDQQIRRIDVIIVEEFMGLVNIVDDDGFSPLILMCRNNRNVNLLKCIKTLIMIPEKKDVNEEFSVDVNYQDSNGFNALHYICKNYLGNDFSDIFPWNLEEWERP